MNTALTSPFSLETQSSVHKQFLRSGDVTELYLTAFAPEGLPLAEQAAIIFEELASELHAHNAFIFAERIFATQPAVDALRAARIHAYGLRDDGVVPTWLLGPGADARILGVQIHAVAGCGVPDVLLLDDEPFGRILRYRGSKRVTLSGLGGQVQDSPQEQYADACNNAERLLEQAGMDFRSVARTWWWMRDILDHYSDFNRVRREFFARIGERKAEAPGAASEQSAKLPAFTPPASTGIGIRPLNGGLCALDVTAASGDAVRTQFFQGAGNQRAASEYGSAFARASRVDALGLRTVYVSGTADIDAGGRTCHIGDAKAQIVRTLENVAAVLKDLGCSIDNIVHACAYSKTPEIERIWRAMPMSRRIPAVPVVTDVCRNDLLFELEATALVHSPGVTILQTTQPN